MKSDAVRAFTVRRLKEGGQSIIIYSNESFSSARRFFKIIARFGRAWKVSAVRAASAVQTSMKSSVLFNICLVAFVSLVAQSNLIGFGKVFLEISRSVWEERKVRF